MFILIALNIFFSLAQIPIIFECNHLDGDCKIMHSDEDDISNTFRTLYIVGSALLVFIYFLEIIIFVVVIINVRRLFKYLDVEYYNLLKLPLGLFILFVLFFLVYRIGYFVVLQF